MGPAQRFRCTWIFFAGAAAPPLRRAFSASSCFFCSACCSSIESLSSPGCVFFFFNDTATTEIYTGQLNTMGRVTSATMSTPRSSENMRPGGMAPMPVATIGPE